MKQLFIFLLIVSVSGQAFVRTAWTLHYQWNRAVYLKNCENRDKPNLHCDGKCYLKKKMAVSENSNPKEPQLPQGFREIKDIQLYFESCDLFPHLAGVPARLVSLPPFTRRFLPDVPEADIFKPPAA
jgi:hypothetical protein